MLEPSAVVTEAESRLRPLEAAAARAWWDANVHASDETERLRVEAELARSAVLADPDLFGRIRAAREQGAEPLVRRQLDLLHDAFLPHQVPESLRTRLTELEASVESRFSRHRGVVGGVAVGDNEIKRILRTSDDEAERREAWEASKTVGAEVADDVRRLARLRNEIAHTLGYRDWFQLSVATSELDEARLLATLEETDRLTAEPFGRWKAALDESLAARFACSTAELRPWHYGDPFFQEVPADGGVDLDPVFAGQDVVALARRTYDGLGLDVATIVEASDLYPREGKCQHAFCIDVDREGDVRMLCNVEHDRYWAETMLHELGHGVYDVGVDPALPWLLRTMHLVATEGIAILMGRLAGDPAWLAAVADVPADEAERLGAPLRRAHAAELALFARWVLVMTSFERGLYADPEADLDALWWELVHRHQGLTPPHGRRAPDWAAKIHVAVAPVYYHTYLYGQLVASQLEAALAREFGGLVDRPAAGSFLVERMFRPGQALRWDALLERATGEPLTAAHAARVLAAL